VTRRPIPASVSDKPGHILEIPDSLGRDVDRFHAGTGPAPPMEAFMSDASLEQVERQTAAASSPVHAEDLRPISGAEAARRTTFDGEHLPAMPARRRVIPAPFARPSVCGGTHGKTWQRVRADQVRKGDIVPGVGLVALVHERLRRETVAGVAGVATRVEFVLTGAGGVIQAFSPGEQVQVFRS